jgi:uncharacterized membrane protein YedE/YeeE
MYLQTRKGAHMNIAWDQFTPLMSLAGGVLIGVAAALFVLGSGRIAGVAGILGAAWQAALRRQSLAQHAMRWAFVVGLLVSPWVWSLFAPLPRPSIDVGPLALIGAGLLVGFGVRMGNGCTSGHGVCGLARLSPRSLVSVLVFMGAGFATVYLLRHVIGGAA